MIAFCLAGALLLLAFVTDTTKQKIPNELNLVGIISGIAIHSYLNGWAGLAFAAMGLACGLLPMLALYAIKAVGAGDVKLFAALGALTGAAFSLYAMVASLWIAGIGGLLLLLWRSDRLSRLKQLGFIFMQLFIFRQPDAFNNAVTSDKALRFPFMWAVLPGSIYCFVQWGSL